VLVWLGYINVSLAVFNMIPAFPLDGGRVLRSIVWAITKNQDRSTRIAARVGQVAAFLFILEGIWKCFSGAGFGGLWIALIGWFLLDAARASYAHGQKTTATAIPGMRVSELMSRGCVTVDRGMSLRELVDIHLLKTSQQCFAVKDRGRFAGLITRSGVAAIPRELWDETTVGAAMHPLEELPVITPDTSVLDALKLLRRSDVSQLPVIANGVLLGTVFRSQLAELLRARRGIGRFAPYPAIQLRDGNAARGNA
jgi:CBS domain-containing protein